MCELLKQLEQLDLGLLTLLSSDDPNIEEIVQKVDIREQLLHELFQAPEKRTPERWHHAIERTQLIVLEMNKHTDKFASKIKQLQHSKKSVQLYKKFQ
ncbi:flagellar protein FliT [Vibrio sp. Of7-15]|uniref:flagellar protein FliT n=1 Tax=Vibrio sp. Of7-15 TaxID=2724879 RepID=UPI001EF38BB2|nr:flagellar protein FliT [Vibrio sp. Of7-15]MCG7499160.1 flagellar protein FliT [Vibrio sp. Of7-15]